MPTCRAALALLIVTVAAPAIAQAQRVIEEIIVTAQKREQSAQDVGIAITAISGETLRKAGIDQPQHLHQLATNVGLQNIGGGGIPIIIVRGIGLQSLRVNDSPTTAFYVDEVYQTSVVSAEWTMFDLDRVEILKGPQGGLYGRNALGGAIQIISNTPDLDAGPNGYVQVGYGEFGKAEAEAAAGFGLSETLGMRIAGRWTQSSEAAYRDVTLDQERGKDDRYALRVITRFEPGESTEIVVKLHGGKDDSQLPPLRPIGIFADIGTGNPIGRPNVSLGLLNGLVGLGLGDPLCSSVRGGQGSDAANCADVSGVPPADYGTASDVFAGPSGFRAFRDTAWLGASLNMRFGFADHTLQSITAFDSIDYRRVVDFDGTPWSHQHIDYGTRIDSISQEFRLFYESGDEINWFAGLSYAEDELSESSLLDATEGAVPLLFAGGTTSPQDYVQETTALAIYGHLEWGIADELTLIGELRYTHAKKTFAGGSEIGFPDGTTVPFVSTDDAIDFQSPAGKLGVEWRPSANVLVFGNLSLGFKTGGFFGGFATSPEQLEPFDEETVIAYEAGLKTESADGRLRINGSVFFYDRRDVQQNAGDPTSVVQIKRVANIGDVEAYGAEADLTWLPADSLTLSVSVGATNSAVSDSDFVQAASLPLLPDAALDGTNTPNYSKFSANFLVRYDRYAGADKELFLQLDGRYQSDSDLSVITDPIEKSIFREPSYELINLRAGFGSDSGSWQLQGFVENLADEEYRTTVRNDGTFGVYALAGLPRTWGVRYIYSWP